MMEQARHARRRMAFAIAVVATMMWSSTSTAQVGAPRDFTIPKADGSPGEVRFSHQRHTTKVGKCTTCHMKDFKMKRGASGPITLEAKQAGKFCGACHDGKTQMGGAVVFPIDECEKCHQ